MGERDGRERAARDGRVAGARRSGRAAAATRSGHTVSGWEGRRVGEGQWRAASEVMCPRRSHACGSGERKCHRVFLFFLEKQRRTEGGAEQACWA